MSSFTYNPIKQTLREEIKYVTRGGTAKYLFTKNLMDGCEGEKGLDYASQCMAIERIYEKVPKKGETRCYDFILAPDPADGPDPEKVLRFAWDVASEYFRDYQVVAAVHTDTESPHAHIVVNAVNLLTGNKLNMSDAVYFRMRQWVDDLGERRYGFSKWDPNRNSDNSYNRAELEQLKRNNMTGPRWELRRSVLTNKGRAVSEEDFYRLMKDEGVDVESSKDGRDYVYRMPAYISRQSGKPLGIRGSTLGRLYTKDCVLDAIAERTARPKSFPGDLSEEGTATTAETLIPGEAEKLSESTCHGESEGAERETFSDVCGEPAMTDGQTDAVPEDDMRYARWEADTLPEDAYRDDDEAGYEDEEWEIFSDVLGELIAADGQTDAAPEDDMRYARWEADISSEDAYRDDDEDVYEVAEEEVFSGAYAEPAMTDGQISAMLEEDARYARWEADTLSEDAYHDGDDEEPSGDKEERILSGILCDFAVPDAPIRDASAEPYMQDADMSANRSEDISLESGEHADREIAGPRAEIAADGDVRPEASEDATPLPKRTVPGPSPDIFSSVASLAAPLPMHEDAGETAFFDEKPVCDAEKTEDVSFAGAPPAEKNPDETRMASEIPVTAKDLPQTPAEKAPEFAPAAPAAPDLSRRRVDLSGFSSLADLDADTVADLYFNRQLDFMEENLLKSPRDAQYAPMSIFVSELRDKTMAEIKREEEESERTHLVTDPPARSGDRTPLGLSREGDGVSLTRLCGDRYKDARARLDEIIREAVKRAESEKKPGFGERILAGLKTAFSGAGRAASGVAKKMWGSDAKKDTDGAADKKGIFADGLGKKAAATEADTHETAPSFEERPAEKEPGPVPKSTAERTPVSAEGVSFAAPEKSPLPEAGEGASTAPDAERIAAIIEAARAKVAREDDAFNKMTDEYRADVARCRETHKKVLDFSEYLRLSEEEREVRSFRVDVWRATKKFDETERLDSIFSFNLYTVCDIWADYARYELDHGRLFMGPNDYVDAVDGLLDENGGSVKKVREKIRFNPPSEFIPSVTGEGEADREAMLLRLHGGVDTDRYFDRLSGPLYRESDALEKDRKKAERERNASQRYKDGK